MGDRPVAVITGITGNLGGPVARRLVEDGFDVVGVAGLASHSDLSNVALYLRADATDRTAMLGVAEAVQQKFARLDALVHCVGGFTMGALVHETSDTDFDAMFDMNVRSTLATVHALTPPMIAAGHGKIVLISALAANRGAARMGAYAAAKGALLRLAETMSDELRGVGINVNCVLPSTMATAQNRKSMGDRPMVSLDDVADVCAFLVSDRAKGVHGAAIPVRGMT